MVLGGGIQHGGDQLQNGKTWCPLRLMRTVVLTLRIVFGLLRTFKEAALVLLYLDGSCNVM